MAELEITSSLGVAGVGSNTVTSSTEGVINTVAHYAPRNVHIVLHNSTRMTMWLCSNVLSTVCSTMCETMGRTTCRTTAVSLLFPTRLKAGGRGEGTKAVIGQKLLWSGLGHQLHWIIWPGSSQRDGYPCDIIVCGRGFAHHDVTLSGWFLRLAKAGENCVIKLQDNNKYSLKQPGQGPIVWRVCWWPNGMKVNIIWFDVMSHRVVGWCWTWTSDGHESDAVPLHYMHIDCLKQIWVYFEK